MMKYKNLICAFLSFMILGELKSFDRIRWEASCEQSCDGVWIGLPTSQRQQNDQEPFVLSAKIQKQRFDLKKKKMTGENFSLIGPNALFSGPTAIFYYDSEQLEWSFKEGFFGQVAEVYFESQSASYWQKKQLVEAQNLSFLYIPLDFTGHAASLNYNDRHLVLKEVDFSPCPAASRSWEIQADEIRYDIEKEDIYIEHPRVLLYGYEIFSLEHMQFSHSRPQHVLRNLPKISVESGSGLTLRYPFLWQQNDYSVEFIPHLNSDAGVGTSFKIEKSGWIAKTFFDLLPFGSEPSFDWMVQSSYHGQEGNLSYDYDVGLVSDDLFYYHYPQLVSFWRNRYLVNSGRIAQQTPYGVLSIFSEKLIESALAKDLNQDISEYLFQAQWANDHYGYQQISWDVIYQKQAQKAYQRAKFSNSFALGRGYQIDYAGSFYPKEESFNGFFAAECPLTSVQTPLGQLALFYVGQKSLSYGQSLLVDVIAQPINSNFLYQSRHHHGVDWAEDADWVTAQWLLDISGRTNLEVACAYRWNSFDSPWNAPAQPYLNLFREEDVFSPLSLRLYDEWVDLSMMIDLKRSDFITFSCSVPLRIDPYKKLFLGGFYHKYYPQDRLSQEVTKVAQVFYRYDYRLPNSWFGEISSRFDVIEGEVSDFYIKHGYEDCCWTFSIYGGGKKDYDPEKEEMEWHYKAGIEVALKSTGFYQGS